MENFENLISTFYDLSESDSREYAKRVDELRASLHFNVGYIDVYLVKATALDVNGNEIKVIYDAIS